MSRVVTGIAAILPTAGSPAVQHAFSGCSPPIHRLSTPAAAARQHTGAMNMREVHLELEALEIGLRESGGLAVRLLRSAATACAGRDAARANVVLAFEHDA